MEYKFQKMTIDDVCTVTDCLHKTAPSINKPTEYRMLRTNNIRDGKLRNIEDTKSVTKDIYDEWSIRGYIEPKDVILTREAPMGEVALIGENENYNFFLGQRLLQLKAKVNVMTPEFLYYSLQTNFLRHQIMMNEGTGSVVSNIRIPLLKKMSILVPPIHIQKKLTNILSKIDNKIKINQRIIANLEELSQTLFKRWFVDFEFPDENRNPYKSSGGQLTDSELGFIPQGWSIRTIDQVAEFINGYAFKSKDLIKINPGNYLHVFKMGHIKRGGGLKHDGTKDYYPKDIPEKLNKYILKRGDILMSMTDMKSNVAILGHTALMDQDDKYIVNQRVGLLRILDKAILDYPYLYILTNTSEFINELRKKANSGVQVNLSSAVIKKEPIILPPAEVHKEFNDIARNYYQQIFNLSRENEHLKTLRDILLPKLMSGEIELPDELEADEHAELLQ